MMNNRGVWVYAISRGLSSQPFGTAGVDGEGIRTVSGAGLTAIVGTVGLERFGENALRHNLEDLDWLAAVARAHDRVIAAAAELNTTVPMRLATVYMDDSAVSDMLASHQAALDEALRRLHGHTEWGVKGYAEAAVPASPASVPSAGHDANEGTGTAYLHRKRAQLSARDETENLAYRQAQAVHESLGQLADDQRLHPPQDPKLTHTTTAMVLNAAYLIDDAHTASFAEAVTTLADSREGIRLELTGPWPAYSFAGVEGTST